MPYTHFNEHDAHDLINLIKRRRPNWNDKAIGEVLRKASESDLTLGQITTAAENAANDKTAKTPEAILFDKYRQSTAKNKTITGNMLCVECATKHPVTEMTKLPHGWVCNQHQEDK